MLTTDHGRALVLDRRAARAGGAVGVGGAADAHAVAVGRPRRAGGAASVERVAAIGAGRDAAALIAAPSGSAGFFASPAPAAAWPGTRPGGALRTRTSCGPRYSLKSLGFSDYLQQSARAAPPNSQRARMAPLVDARSQADGSAASLDAAAKAAFAAGRHEESAALFGQLLLTGPLEPHLVLCNRSAAWARLGKWAEAEGDARLVGATSRRRTRRRWTRSLCSPCTSRTRRGWRSIPRG